MGDQELKLWNVRKWMKKFVPIVHAENWDKIDPDLAEKYRELYAPLPGETGWDRIKMLFITDNWGKRHPEMDFALQGVMLSWFMGCGIGGIIGARNATDEFILKNEASKFYTELDAKRRLNDHVFKETYRSAFKWGWRTSLFTGVYLLSLTLVSSYRNKTTLSHYVGAGAVAGSLYRFRMGPRAMIVAGGLGSFLGLIAGSACMTAFWLSGSSMEQIHYWRMQHRIAQESEVHGKIMEQRKAAQTILAVNERKLEALKTKENASKETPANEAKIIVETSKVDVKDTSSNVA